MIFTAVGVALVLGVKVPSLTVMFMDALVDPDDVLSIKVPGAAACATNTCPTLPY